MESRITEKVGDATMMYEQMKLKIVSRPPLFSRQLQAFGLRLASVCRSAQCRSIISPPLRPRMSRI